MNEIVLVIAGAILMALVLLDIAYLLRLALVVTKGIYMSKNSIEALTAAVERDTTIKAGAVTFIQGLLTELSEVKAELAGKGVDVSILDNLTAKLDAGTDALASALEANVAVVTPAEPVADPAPDAPAPTE